METNQRRLITCIFLPVAFIAGITAQPQFFPDHKGQPLGPGMALMPNVDQIAYTDHTQVPNMEYASTGNPVKLFLREGPELSFVSTIRHADTTVQDTTFRVDVSFVGESANGQAAVYEGTHTSWYHNYFLPQCPTGRTEVHGFERLVYESVYPFIDFHILSNPWGHKFYFAVRPGGDPSDIMMRFQGHDELQVDVLGGLRILLEDRWIRLPQAIAYEVDGNNTVSVPWTVSYTEVALDLIVQMQFGTYDPGSCS